jgi:GNAT superfamily N-acetyltransferase
LPFLLSVEDLDRAARAAGLPLTAVSADRRRARVAAHGVLVDLLLWWNAEHGLLDVWAPLPFEVPDDRRAAVDAAIAASNARMSLPGFLLLPERRRVGWRNVQLIGSQGMDDGALFDLVQTAVTIVATHGSAIAAAAAAALPRASTAETDGLVDPLLGAQVSADGPPAGLPAAWQARGMARSPLPPRGPSTLRVWDVETGALRAELIARAADRIHVERAPGFDPAAGVDALLHALAPLAATTRATWIEGAPGDVFGPALDALGLDRRSPEIGLARDLTDPLPEDPSAPDTLPLAECPPEQVLATLEAILQRSANPRLIGRTARSLWSEILHFQARTGAEDHSFLARVSGEAVGLVVQSVDRSPERTGSFQIFGVVPTARGRGVGPAMFRHALRTMAVAGASWYRDWVSVHDARALIGAALQGCVLEARGGVAWSSIPVPGAPRP